VNRLLTFLLGLAVGVGGTLGALAVLEDPAWHDAYRQCIERAAVEPERFSEPEDYYDPGTPGAICQGRTRP
jgi:hypothetical protein